MLAFDPSSSSHAGSLMFGIIIVMLQQAIASSSDVWYVWDDWVTVWGDPIFKRNSVSQSVSQSVRQKPRLRTWPLNPGTCANCVIKNTAASNGGYVL
jgi:hypothetical protein